MTELTLFIGNKNYSSWSYRPWFALKMAGIEFVEELVPFDMEAGNPLFQEFSPTGRVPVLKDGDLVLAESLAILDHLARKHPEKGLWPARLEDHSHAMAICCEMVGGFSAIRNQCPMNIRRKPSRMEQDAALVKDVARIEQIWSECLSKSGGPFLFGDFSIADAMYAPVVNRMEIYQLTENKDALRYMSLMKEQPAWQEWQKASIAEPWIVDEDEV